MLEMFLTAQRTFSRETEPILTRFEIQSGNENRSNLVGCSSIIVSTMSRTGDEGECKI